MSDPLTGKRAAFAKLHELAVAGLSFNEIAARLGAKPGELAEWMRLSSRLKNAFTTGRAVAQARRQAGQRREVSHA